MSELRWHELGAKGGKASDIDVEDGDSNVTATFFRSQSKKLEHEFRIVIEFEASFKDEQLVRECYEFRGDSVTAAASAALDEIDDDFIRHVDAAFEPRWVRQIIRDAQFAADEKNSVR